MEFVKSYGEEGKKSGDTTGVRDTMITHHIESTDRD